MSTIGRVLTGLSSALSSALEFNSATLSGAIDIIVVSDDRGRRHCSPFHVRFGKLQLLKSRGCPVTVELNGRRTDLRLYLGPAGEAYFYNPKACALAEAASGTEGAPAIPSNPAVVRGDPSSSSEPPHISEHSGVEIPAPVPPMTPRGAAAPEESTLIRPSSLPQEVGNSPPSFPCQCPTNSDLVRTASAPMPIASEKHPPNAFLTGARDAQAQAFPLLNVGVDDSAGGYVSDSEVEVSKNEREGTVEVVDEPRSPPVSGIERRMVNVYSRSRSLRQAKAMSNVPASTASAGVAEESAANYERASVEAGSAAGVPASVSPAGHLPEASESAIDLAAANGGLPVDEKQFRSCGEFPEDSVVADFVAEVVAEVVQGVVQDVAPKEVGADSSKSPLSSSSVTNLTSPEVGPGDQTRASTSSAGSDVVPRMTKEQLESVTLSPDAEQEAIVAEEAKLEVRSLDGYDEDEADGGMRLGRDDLPIDGRTEAGKTSSDVPHPEEISRAVSEAFNGDDPASHRCESSVPQTRRPVLHSAALEESDMEPNTMLAMALCGHHILPDMTEEQMGKVFEQHRLSQSDFAANPNVLFDPDLLFCIDDRLVEFRIAAPFVMSSLAYGVPLDVDMLTTQMQHPPGVEPRSRDEGNGDNGVSQKNSPDGNSTQVPEQSGGGFGTWFSWSRAPASPAPVGVPLLSEEDLKALDATATQSEDTTPADKPSPNTSVDQAGVDENMCMWDSPRKEDLPEDDVSGDAAPSPTGIQVDKSAAEGTLESEVGEAKAESLPALVAVGKAHSELPRPVSLVEPTETDDPSVNHGWPGDADAVFDSSNEFLSNVPTPEQLAELDLQPGANTIRFIVESSLAEVNCRIFLWGPDVKIVISDVDGTITKSDVLGHVLPVVGRDWSHVGVAGLYSEIAKHGYKFMYLTARPIGQASQTRGFLNSVIQGGARLPNGPVLMSPNRLVESFTREVIRRKPQEFKIQALREVRSLFAMEYNPFHAGFGNRETDVISYRAVGVIPHRIFVVNTSNELVVNSVRYESAASYNSLKELVNSVFPDIMGKVGRDVVGSVTDGASYNDWNFWKPSLPDVDLESYLGGND